MSKDENLIIDVWAYNLEEEMNKISRLIDKYPFVAMDTEFPGIIHFPGKLKESNYKNIKTNVDELKLIQCGISISDEKGNCPPECSTWQFNLKFDKNRDRSASDSIALLVSSGIEFDKLVTDGITHDSFGEALITSGLILNEDIRWVSFHGSYDFSYLLKVITNLPLPETEIGFLETLRLYFPIIYDIRHMTRNLDGLAKSLQRLAQDLDVSRIGTQHQAGSDALITLNVFHKLVVNYLTTDNIKNDENILFLLGPYYEEESSMVFEGSLSSYFDNTLSQPYIPLKPNNSQQFDINNYYNQQNNSGQYGYNQHYFKPSSSSFNYNTSQQYTQQGFGVDFQLPLGLSGSSLKFDKK